MKANEAKTILIADDHVIIRRGLKLLLDQYFEKAQLIEADTTKDVLEALATNSITYMILDMQLQDANIMQILPQIQDLYPNIPILIYTMSSEDIFGARLLQMGVQGFLSKQSNEEEVVKALQQFFDGQTYISAQLQDILTDNKQSYANPLLSLSERELTVLSHMLKGEAVKEISNQLNLKATTVATYKARIFEKLAVTNIIDLRNLIDIYQFKSI